MQMKVLTSWQHIYVFDKSSTNDIAIIKDAHDAFENKVSVRTVMLPNGFIENLQLPSRGCKKLTYAMFGYAFLQWTCMYFQKGIRHICSQAKAYVLPKISNTKLYVKAGSYATYVYGYVKATACMHRWWWTNKPQKPLQYDPTLPAPNDPVPIMQQAPAVFQADEGLPIPQHPTASNTNTLLNEDVDVYDMFGTADDLPNGTQGYPISQGFTMPFNKKQTTYDVFPIQYEPSSIVEDKNAVFLVKYTDAAEVMKYCMLPYECNKLLPDLQAYGLEVVRLKDAVLFPKEVKKIVYDVIRNLHIDDQDMYLSVLYNLRKMLLEKVDYGTYLKSVLEFMYVNYEYASSAKPIPIRELYTKFTTHNTYTLKSEVSHMVSCNKFEIILQYLGFEVRSGQVYSRAHVGEPKKLQFGAKLTTHDKIKKNTSYWTKKVVQLRREPNVANKTLSPWMNPTAHVMGE